MLYAKRNQHSRWLLVLGCLLFEAILLFGFAVAETKTNSATGMIDTAAAVPGDSSVVRPLVYTMTVDGAIDVVTNERIAGALKQCEKGGAKLLVILLDTPGGFTTATWSINKQLLNSPVPVCVFIFPPGARAGSAGVYITYAANFAAMAPSTNIGAAHPVSGEGKQIDSVMNEKITNDAVAKIKAAAARHGRNAEWAEKAVRESVSITDEEALKLHVIDLIAEDVDDLLTKLNGQKTEVSFGEVTMHLDDAHVVNIEITFVEKLRKLITNPSVVFLLFSIGGLGIVLELYNPGAILPGVVGAICLILAFYAFQTLPINYAGVALILLAILLFIAEIKVISHGLLTIGGVISLILGGTLLINDIDPAVQVSKTMLFTVGGFILVILLIVIYLVARVQRNVPFVGEEGMIGKIAEARTDGFVFVNGALWKAECDEPLTPGDKVEITAVEGLTLKVRKHN